MVYLKRSLQWLIRKAVPMCISKLVSCLPFHPSVSGRLSRQTEWPAWSALWTGCWGVWGWSLPWQELRGGWGHTGLSRAVVCDSSCQQLGSLLSSRGCGASAAALHRLALVLRAVLGASRVRSVGADAAIPAVSSTSLVNLEKSHVLWKEWYPQEKNPCKVKSQLYLT